MATTTKERNKAIILAMGEKMIRAIHSITAGEPISMAALLKLIKKTEREKRLKKELPSAALAKELGVSVRTLYRK